ncbi:MAG: UDP-N-acetylglucosamine pyrophosphorylase [Coriobacteriia bacterium]|nr:UDP-N-acetylglucosamine pyrophosphorylase [Coriobacteriia bacterium]
MHASIADLYDLSNTIAAPLLQRFTYPWEALAHIKEYILELGPTLPESEYDHPAEGVWIAKDATIFESAYVGSPLIVDHEAEVRHCAFMRCPAIVGKGAVVGNSTELKNVILFDKVQVPHYNYVGDSILGYCSHMGAGSITSNLKSDKSLVRVKDFETGEVIETGIKKFGAMLGDHVEVGCNSVLNPGTVIGCNTNIYPLSRVRGYVHGGVIFKDPDNVVVKH